MVRGFYTAAAGMLARQKAFNVLSNNIANSGTAGYKSQITIESSFGDHYVARINSLNDVPDSMIGSGSFITVNDEEYSDMTQGSLEDTGRDLDVAINGEGFFLAESETLGEVMTRNGQFTVDEEGYLVLSGVGKILNDARDPIQLDSTDFSIGATGILYDSEGEEADALFIGVPQADSVMKIDGTGVYKLESGEAEQAAVGTYNVMQGYIEKSNINVSKEMTRIIASQNHFNSCVQILKMYDKINEISVNKIGQL